MIRSLESALPVYPALPKVLVECQCGEWRPIGEHVSCQVAGAEDGSAILTCDDPAEVGEMVEAECVCAVCGNHYMLTPDRSTCCEPSSCHSVTHRIFLWTGEPVDWEKVLPHWDCDGCGFAVFSIELDLERQSCPICGPPGSMRWGVVNGSHTTLTAVVLVANEWCSFVDAIEACAEAGVPIVSPGDQEKGRLEL